MNQNKPESYIFVIGNEKGGAGKTTCSMHLIAGLVDRGFKVSSIDADCRQHSLTRYVQNREEYNKRNPEQKVATHHHILLNNSTLPTIAEREQEELVQFQAALEEAKKLSDIIVIDTPGTHSFLSKLAHSHADTIITPINDSFVDLDVMAKVNGEDFSVISPSIYSQMIWEQKMIRAQRDRGSINWVVMRNRLAHLDAHNKRNVESALQELAKRISFRLISGFSERVIFRELFLHGLTLLDLTNTDYVKKLNISHIAARQELRMFLDSIGADELARLYLTQ